MVVSSCDWLRYDGLVVEELAAVGGHVPRSTRVEEDHFFMVVKACPCKEGMVIGSGKCLLVEVEIICLCKPDSIGLSVCAGLGSRARCCSHSSSLLATFLLPFEPLRSLSSSSATLLPALVLGMALLSAVFAGGQLLVLR